MSQEEEKQNRHNGFCRLLGPRVSDAIVVVGAPSVTNRLNSHLLRIIQMIQMAI